MHKKLVGSVSILAAVIVSAVYHFSRQPAKPDLPPPYIDFPQSPESLSAIKPISEDELYTERINRNPNFHILRAHNLLAAHHFSEAEKQYRLGISGADRPFLGIENSADIELALACAHQGKYDEALRIIGTSGQNFLRAEVLYRQQKFDELLQLTTGALTFRPAFERGDYWDIPQRIWWLRARASALCQKGRYEEAMAALKEAVRLDVSTDGTSADQCVSDINKLKDYLGHRRHSTLADFPLPKDGKERVLGLLARLKKLDHAGGLEIEWISGVCTQDDEIYKGARKLLFGPPCFKKFSYRDTFDHINVDFDLKTQICAVTHDDVMKLMPEGGKRDPYTDIDSESWTYPGGAYRMSFTRGKNRLLESFNYDAPTPCLDLVCGGGPPTESIILAHLNKPEIALKMIDRRIALNSRVPHWWIMRAKAHHIAHQDVEAIKDIQHAVDLGGRYYFGELAKYEAFTGQIAEAIEHYEIFLGTHRNTYETARYEEALADLYERSGEPARALELIIQTLAHTGETPRGIFVKARAEAALGKKDAAIVDGAKAEKLFFEAADISGRDRVIEWRNSNQIKPTRVQPKPDRQKRIREYRLAKPASFITGQAKIPDAIEVNGSDFAFGMVAKDGSQVIPPIYMALDGFIEDTSLAQLHSGAGLLDRQGKFVLEPYFEGLARYKEGLAAAQANNLIGYIDKNGNWKIKPRYIRVSGFSSGMAFVTRVDGNCVYVDMDGNETGLIPKSQLIEKESANFCDTGGLDIQSTYLPDAFRYFHSSIYKFREGLPPMVKDGKIGYIDKTGRFII